MPAAAVIPAPIGYIKVVAVKKLVVEFLLGPLARSRAGNCALERPPNILWAFVARVYSFAAAPLRY